VGVLALTASFLGPGMAAADSKQSGGAQALSTRKDWAGQPKFKPGQVLVRFRPGVSKHAVEAAHSLISGRAAKTWSIVEGLQLVHLPANRSVREALRAYRQNPNVLYAEPNYVVHALGAQAASVTPNDPKFPQMWNLQNTGQEGGTLGADIRATQAWGITTGSSNVVIAIIDTGIDYNHEDLAANVWSNPATFTTTLSGTVINCAAGTHGFNAIAHTCDPLDDDSHGSHVSGTIGAVGNNGVGVTGLNWTVRLLACKFLDQNGQGNTADAITCLEFVKAIKDTGVNIVATNNSWGGGPFSQALSDAVAAQQKDGILFIAAAGNDFSDNDQTPSYPASLDLPNVISVAATTRFDGLADFSNIGHHSVLLGAPGQEILSTTPNNTYSVLSGTSMAAPHVTGLAALLAAQNPTRDWRAIKNLILAGGVRDPALSPTVTGRRLDAFGSMTCSNQVVESRLRPSQSVIAGSVGSRVRLEILNINCALPAGAMQVTVSPGGIVVDLVDDGTGADIAAGDGVFTGQWIPSQQGSYVLSFPGGDAVDVEILENYTPSPTPYNSVPITGTNLNLGDDAVAQISSPFPIAFGGGNFTSLFVSSNGTISFTEAFDGYANGPLPQLPPTAPGQLVLSPPFFSMVTPFWQDLVAIPNSSQNVFWQVTSAAPNRQLVVEWRNMRSFECPSDASANVTFQTVFSESSSDIIFNYANTIFGGNCASQDNGADATVGIQTSPGIGAQWSFDAADVGSSRAIRWQLAPTSPPPSNPVPVISSVSPLSAQVGTTSITLTVNGANFVNTSRVHLNGSDLLTAFLSPTQLSAIIPPSVLNDPIILIQGQPASITVSNPQPGGGLSNAIAFPILNPGPTLTSLSPSSALAGSLSFRLTVNGTGFVFGASVYWNGQPTQFTVFNSSTQLVAPVFLSQLSSAGTAQVTVVNPSPGGGTSNAFTFAIQAPVAGTAFLRSGLSNVPRGTLPPVAPSLPKPPFQFLGWKYASQRGGEYLRHFTRPRAGLGMPFAKPDSQGTLSASADGSGIQPQTAGSVPALGSTTAVPPVVGFQLPKSLPTDFLPTSIATGDFNKDGHQDWVVANGGGNNLWLYLGKGDGTASLPAIIPLRGQTPVWVITADLRKIGILDLVVAEADSGTVEVLLGNGDGTFGAGALYFMPASPINVSAADFNGDGKIDILVGLNGAPTPGSLVVLPGDGVGHFLPPKLVPAESLFAVVPVSVAVMDLNGDGFPDVLIVDANSAVVSAYLNERDGTFKFSQTIYTGFPALGIFPISAALGDVNKDGCSDAIVTDTLGIAWEFFGNCDGTFQANFSTQVQPYGAGDVAIGLALVDVNHDGNLDLVTSGFVLTEANFPFGQVGGNMLTVRLGDGHGNFGLPHVYRGAPSMVALAAVDLAGTGFPSLITVDQDDDSTTVFNNDGAGSFGGAQGGYVGYAAGVNLGGVTNAPFSNSNFVPIDVNGDGKPDLVVLDFGRLFPDAFQLTVLLNDGTGKFGPLAQYPVVDATLPIGDFKLADFRNTGKPDFVAIGNQFSTGVPFISFAANRGDGSFAPPLLTRLPNAQGIFAVGDFNGDGKLDLAVADGDGFCVNTAACLTIFLGNGDGTFRQGFSVTFDTQAALGSFPGAIYVGDFNKDGKLDVLVWMASTLEGTIGKDVFEFLGKGDGTFQPPKDILPNFGNFALVDLNHDGLPDIVEMVEAGTTLTSGSPAFAIWLGQSDGTFKKTNTYQPYAGDVGIGYFFGSGMGNGGSPLVADFNGDGNPDIAVFQQVPGENPNTFQRQTYLQILLGNGDGTFTPSYNKTEFHQLRVPNSAIDVNGDGRSDLVELDAFTSSFNVVSAIPGPSFQIAMESNPVLGLTGGVFLSLSLPSSVGTTITLTSSDPAITIPASVTIPPGALMQLVPFQIGNGFNSTHVFSIQATLGNETEIAYGVKASPNTQYGFSISLGNSTEAVLPGGTTLDYSLGLTSLAGYATTVQLQCQGLPPGFACQFGQNLLPVSPGNFTLTRLIVFAPSNAAQNSYPFTIIASDASITHQINATLKVGDFAIVLSPNSQSALPGAVLNFGVTVTSVNGYNQAVNLSCGNLPPGASCAFDSSNIVAQNPGFTAALTITLPALAQGSYPFTVSGASGPVTHTQAGQIVVGGLAGSIAPNSATIQVGSSANFTVTVVSQNSFTGIVSFSCGGPGALAVFCNFQPFQGTLPPNGSLTTTLSISVSQKPASIRKQTAGVLPFQRPLVQMGLLLGLGILTLIVTTLHASPSNRLRLSAGFAVILLAACLSFVFTSCGGGSAGGGGSTGSGSNGGGNGGGGGGNPSSVSLTIQASTEQTTITLGTVTITVP
jgi:subtilisin family serine protease